MYHAFVKVFRPQLIVLLHNDWSSLCWHHVTSKIIVVITYPLEDEQELSLGMLIRPKRIYNFWCSMLVVNQLSYVFTMVLWFIWTNLLIVAKVHKFLFYTLMCRNYLEIGKNARGALLDEDSTFLKSVYHTVFRDRQFDPRIWRQM